MAVTSVLSLLLVPILVRTYGLHAYGLVPLIRLLTPLGALGILMLGLPSFATRAAATPGATKQEIRARQSTLMTLSLLLGAVISLVLAAIGPLPLAHRLDVGAEELSAFVMAFWVLFVSLPLQFVGALLNSALTGRGHLRALRATEVGTSIIYFAVCATAAWQRASIEIVLIALLAGDTLRALILIAYARGISLISLRALFRPDWRWLKSYLKELRILTVASVAGHARKYAASTTIVFLFGPAALGLYDAVERVPRAIKLLLGLVNNAVLPHTLALDAATTQNQLRSLIVRSMRLILFFILPVSIVVMFYAYPLLSLWLGAAQRDAGQLLILLMIPNTLETILSIFSTASLSRLSLIHLQNKVNVLEIVCLVALTFALAPPLGQTAPYVAFACTAGTGYLLRIRSFLDSYNIGRDVWNSLVGKALLGATVGAATFYGIGRLVASRDLTLLVSAPFAVAMGMALIFWLWNKTERRDLGVVYSSVRKLVLR